MNKYDIQTVDILWMDLQGAELLALKGVGTYLQKVKYIHVEVSHKEMYSGQVMFNELNDYILSKGSNSCFDYLQIFTNDIFIYYL